MADHDHKKSDAFESEVTVEELLREETDAELLRRDAEWPGFVASIMQQIETAPQTEDDFEAHEVTLGELLREDIHHEVERRDGEWSAFTANVFRRLDQADVSLQRQSLEAQAVAALRADVDAELQEMSPRFEESFRDEVERRIFRSAREEPGLLVRIVEAMRRAFSPQVRWGLGWAAAAAAVILLVVLPMNDPVPEGVKTRGESFGQVAVERISFEGTVTVSPEPGVTVVWLSDVAS